LGSVKVVWRSSRVQVEIVGWKGEIELGKGPETKVGKNLVIHSVLVKRKGIPKNVSGKVPPGPKSSRSN
jgi:hypothetical protein